MIAVFAIANRADSEDDMHIRIHLAEQIDGLHQILSTLIDREFFLLEERLRPLLTIIHDLARFLQTVYMVSSKRQENYGERRFLCITPLLSQAFDGMENRSGIIHHAKGINHCPEFLLLKTTPNAISEAGAHEKHCLTRSDSKSRIGNINNRSELH